MIFAPAYGSNKKNATDIRMAIDAVELVFIRPEIGTFILLTGDSDFSSLVLKLKEYGKYVIGVGIQESSSDILVQNCDEYYSYTSLTGLTKTTELSAGRAQDPWALVKAAAAKMVARGDVMRSDRLKQVMQEMDANFDEGAIGYSKFSKFLSEAASRGLIELIKVGNGQYEVGPAKGGVGGGEGRAVETESRPRGGRGRGRGRGREAAAPMAEQPSPVAVPVAAGDAPLQGAYDLLRTALERLKESGREPARDSDVKRRILDLSPDFDETQLGFPKFSRFLSQAEEHGIVRLGRGEAGLDVSLGDGTLAPAATPRVSEELDAPRPSAEEREAPRYAEAPPAHVPEPYEPKVAAEPVVIDLMPGDAPDAGLRLGPRLGSTRRRGGDEPPPMFAGQGAPAVRVASTTAGTEVVTGAGAGTIEGLGLPSEPDAIVRYLTHRYKGVGEVTAQMLVEKFGSGLFTSLRDDPDAVAGVIPAGRGEQLIEAWKTDFARRIELRDGGGGASNGNDRPEGRRRGGRGRSRGRPRE